MLKNLKIAVRTSLLIVLVLLIGFFSLWRAVDIITSKNIENNITNQMSDAVRTRSEIIDNYVQTAEESMVEFGLSDEVRDLLMDPTNPEKQAIAQKYTEDFAAVKGIYEGLYIATYDTEVLTHIVTTAVGSFNKPEGEKRDTFQQNVLSKQELTNIGILQSPSTGEMVIAMYSPVYEGGQCIGFVGGGVYASQLMDSLLSLSVEGLPDCEYVFLNVETGAYLYNEDSELLNTETEDEGYKEILEKIRNDNSIDVGTHEYTDEGGNEQMVIYRNFPDRGWVFALKDSYDNIFSELATIQRTTAILCLVVGLVIVGVLIGILSVVGRQLKIINKAIAKLGKLDLEQDGSLKKYTKRKDEIGMISDAVTNTSQNLDTYITEVDQQLYAMATGDYRKEMNMKFIGKFENVESSMKNIQAALRNSFGEIHTVTSELATGSNIVADNAANLAENAVNANQLILEIDNHVNSLSDKVSSSAQAAAESKREMDNAYELVTASQEKMKELSEALEKIQKAAAAIENISGNMEGIAKQTNILALNALVEATRAGETGKGFGVVANEIRDLALQSNDAATDASLLIENVLDSIKDGARVGEETSEYLEKVVHQTQAIDEAIAMIAVASQDQNESLNEVKLRLKDMNKAIETTAAMAEQSSAASTELDSQINVLQDGISKYKV